MLRNGVMSLNFPILLMKEHQLELGNPYASIRQPAKSNRKTIERQDKRTAVTTTHFLGCMVPILIRVVVTTALQLKAPQRRCALNVTDTASQYLWL